MLVAEVRESGRGGACNEGIGKGGKMTIGAVTEVDRNILKSEHGYGPR